MKDCTATAVGRKWPAQGPSKTHGLFKRVRKTQRRESLWTCISVLALWGCRISLPCLHTSSVYQRTFPLRLSQCQSKQLSHGGCVFPEAQRSKTEDSFMVTSHYTSIRELHFWVTACQHCITNACWMNEKNEGKVGTPERLWDLQRWSEWVPSVAVFDVSVW